MKVDFDVPAHLSERVRWIGENFPEFQLKQTHLPFLDVAERNTPLDGSESEEDDGAWVATDENILIEFKPITHPLWIEDWDFEWKEVKKHIANGVTFAFYWKENYLAWER